MFAVYSIVWFCVEVASRKPLPGCRRIPKFHAHARLMSSWRCRSFFVFFWGGAAENIPFFLGGGMNLELGNHYLSWKTPPFFEIGNHLPPDSHLQDLLRSNDEKTINLKVIRRTPVVFL